MHLVLLVFAGIVFEFVLGFIVWKIGRIEHDNDDLIWTSLIVGSLLILGIILGQRIEMIGIFEMISLIIGLVLSRFLYEIKFWDFGDTLSVICIYFLSLYFMFNYDFMRVIFYTIIGTLIWSIRSMYRHFSWYKTGKSGLALQFAVFSVSFSEIAVAILRHKGLYFAGIGGIFISLLMYFFRVNNYNFIQWVKIKKRKTMLKR